MHLRPPPKRASPESPPFSVLPEPGAGECYSFGEPRGLKRETAGSAPAVPPNTAGFFPETFKGRYDIASHYIRCALSCQPSLFDPAALLRRNIPPCNRGSGAEAAFCGKLNGNASTFARLLQLFRRSARLIEGAAPNTGADVFGRGRLPGAARTSPRACTVRAIPPSPMKGALS